MMQLQGKKILITRDISQAEGLREKLTLLGAEVICVATISISDPPDWKSFDHAVERASEFDWVVFTSTNAVRQTSMRLSKLNVDRGQLNDLKKAAVGNQTAEAAREAGWEIDLIPDQYQAEGLLDVLVESGIRDKKVWMPKALKARSFLMDELEKAGAVVIDTPVYQNTIPYENRDRLRQVLLHEKIDWITFTSSSTVTNFIKILGDHWMPNQFPKLASIGRITTKTMKQHGLVPCITAEAQNLDGLCQGIVEWEIKSQKTE